MSQLRRKCRFALSKYRDVDLRTFSKDIIHTINETAPDKNPKVFESYFSTDPLSQSEAVAIGRALAKIENLKCYGKNVTIFRLFDGRTCISEASDARASLDNTIKKENTLRGGRMR